MKKEIIYSMKNTYRDDFNVIGYRFGKHGSKAACIVGSTRGDEIQQAYTCSLLVSKLKELEYHGDIVGDNEILVIPEINYPAMNVGKHFWPTTNRDVNRLFPGDPNGETVSKLANGVFEKVKGYSYGIQMASIYIKGDYIPHVRMMETGYHNPGLGNLFGLPYVVVRKPTPYDMSTLNYNWQMNYTQAFTIYSSASDKIDIKAAQQSVSSVLRFLTRMGILKYNCHSGYIASVINEDELTNIMAIHGGFYIRKKNQGDEVERGDVLASIIEPGTGEELCQVLAPTDGVIFFAASSPLVAQHDILFRIVRRLHV